MHAQNYCTFLLVGTKMIFDFLTPPQGPEGRGKKMAVARPIHVSNSHIKLGWILSKGLGDSITDRRMDILTKRFLLGIFYVRKGSQQSKKYTTSTVQINLILTLLGPLICK